MLNIRPIPSKLALKAQNELNENPDRMIESVKILRDWISFQPHLKIPTHDQFLVTVLRSCKHNLEKSKQRIDGICTETTKLPEYFMIRDIQNSKIREIVRLGYLFPIPKVDGEDGFRILIARPGCYDPKKFCFKDFLSLFSILFQYMAETDDNIIISGMHLVVDGANVSTAHMAQYDLMFLKNLFNIYENCASVRMNGIHLINAPAFALPFFDIVKMFTPEKTRNRITIHRNNLEELYNYLPRQLLPSEYGGELGSVEELCGDLLKKLEAGWDMISKWNEYGVDESKRPSPKDQNVEEIYGIDGSFRCLNFD